MESAGVKPLKAYKNSSFLGSRTARNIRILCELEETESRLKDYNVGANIMIFGSARSLPADQWEDKNRALAAELDAATEEKAKVTAQAAYDRHQNLKWMVPYYDKTEELARKLTEWTLNPKNRTNVKKLVQQVDPEIPQTYEFDNGESPLIVCTGGGPGLMEAANKGAHAVPGGRSMGMGISLPFEASLNPYVNPELAFEYHYFFTRKFEMVYYTMGVVATPGGVGTLDELFEVMTLKQTGKIKRDVPIVLFGEEYWRALINFDLMVERGVIAAADRDHIFYTDCPEAAYNFLVKSFETTCKSLPEPENTSGVFKACC